MLTFKQFFILSEDDKSNVSQTKATLSMNELNKYINVPKKNRIPIFIRKLRNKEPFVKAGENNPSLVIDAEPGWVDAVEEDGRIDVEEIPLRNGDTISLKALQKTKEFGGKNKDFIEKGQIENFNTFLKTVNEGQPVTLTFNGVQYPNCVEARKEPGKEVKSDITIYNTNNEPVLFISHKKCCSPKDMMRWGGIAAYKDNPNYPQASLEVNNFLTDLKAELIKQGNVDNEGRPEMFPITGGKGATYKKRIEDLTLKYKACFGTDYGSDKFSFENVQCIIQGPITYTYDEASNSYDIGTSEGGTIWANGTLPTGEYDPCFLCYYADRRNDQGIRHAFIGIWPWGGKSGRELPVG